MIRRGEPESSVPFSKFVDEVCYPRPGFPAELTSSGYVEPFG